MFLFFRRTNGRIAGYDNPHPRIMTIPRCRITSVGAAFDNPPASQARPPPFKRGLKGRANGRVAETQVTRRAGAVAPYKRATDTLQAKSYNNKHSNESGETL